MMYILIRRNEDTILDIKRWT